MEILLVLAGLIAGGGVGVVVTRRFWPRVMVDEDFLRQIEAEKGLLVVKTGELRAIEDVLDEREVDLEERESLIAERLRLVEDKRFHVVFHTDGGAAARKLWEKVQPVGDGVMEFLDGSARRGLKRA